MSKIQLEAARELIILGNYGLARAILMALGENLTAQHWLHKLNEMAIAPKPINSLTDKELVADLDRSEIEEELILRVFRTISGSFENEHQESSAGDIAEFLLNKISSGTPLPISVSTLVALILKRRSSAIFYLENDPLLEKFIALLENGDVLVRELAIDILAQVGSLRTRAALWSNSYNSNSTQIEVQKTQRSGISDQKPSAEVFAMRNKMEILRVTIKPILNNSGYASYEIVVPSVIVTEHIDIASLTIEIASSIAEMLDMDEQARENEEEAYRTYDEDIAPYLDDYEEAEEEDNEDEDWGNEDNDWDDDDDYEYDED